MDYLKRIWSARHFWFHLTVSDLRSRWRRTYFGVLWSLLQPLGLTILISVVFGRIFGVEIGSYAPYIFSGIIIWDCFVCCLSGGSLSFVQADAYIKQTRHPMAIYTLRTVLGNCIVLALAMIPFIAWSVIALPQNHGLHYFAALLVLPVVFLILWPLTTILAYLAVRFRDLPHGLVLVLQALWFTSPVYFKPDVFRAGELHFLIDYNPIYHFLQIIRAPFLDGVYPTWENFMVSLSMACVFIALAFLLGRKLEKKVIYYL